MENPIESLLSSLQPPGSRVLGRWAHFFDQFHYSSKEFYKSVEQNLAIRKIPDLKVDYVELEEGNLFSANRIYLRLYRKRLVFLLCAAPFGAGYFVSSRLIDQRREANPLHYFLAALLLFFFVTAVMSEYGSLAGLIAGGFLFSIAWSWMRIAATSSMEWLEELLLRTPILGPIYVRFFCPMTFYRADQISMYQQAVHCAVMQTVDEMVNAHGLQPLSVEEQKPKTPDWYRR